MDPGWLLDFSQEGDGDVGVRTMGKGVQVVSLRPQRDEGLTCGVKFPALCWGASRSLGPEEWDLEHSQAQAAIKIFFFIGVPDTVGFSLSVSFFSL